MLIDLARRHPAPTEQAAVQRPLLHTATAAEEDRLEAELLQEELAERQRDKEYWLPLKRELEQMRRASRGGNGFGKQRDAIVQFLHDLSRGLSKRHRTSWMRRRRGVDVADTTDGLRAVASIPVLFSRCGCWIHASEPGDATQNTWHRHKRPTRPEVRTKNRSARSERHISPRRANARFAAGLSYGRTHLMAPCRNKSRSRQGKEAKGQSRSRQRLMQS